MSLLDIMQALELQAEAERQEIVERAKKQADEVINQAKARSREVEIAQRDRVDAGAELEEKRIIAKAQTDQQTALANAREALVAKVMQAARAQLIDISNSTEYPNIFRNLLAEGWETAGALDVNKVIIIDKKDAALAARAAQGLSLKAKLVEAELVGGGMIIASADRRQRLVNTLIGRLERATPLIKAHVAEILFEQDQPLRK